MRRKGSLNDWHEFLPVLNEYAKERITFARLAELGREWLAGMSASDLRTKLPRSEAGKVAAYVREHPGCYTRDIAEGTGIVQQRIAELLARLRNREQVRTTKDGFRVRAWPIRSRRAA